MTVGRRPARVDPLGLRLLVGIVLASSLITLLVTAYQLYRGYLDDVDRIESSFALIEASYVPTLINSLWRIDDVQTRVLVDGMASLPDMESVRVTTPEGAEHEKTKGRSRRTLAHELVLVHPEGARVGELVVVASVDRILERLAREVIFILGSNAMKTFLVAGFALVLFHYLVTRHLRRIAEHAQLRALGTPSPSPLNLRRRGDERSAPDSLDLLEAALNEMWRRLAEDREKLSSSEEQLQRHRDDLEGLVAERTEALRQAHEELLRAEQLSTIGRMTATVSHELRNPLGTISASTEVLRGDLPALEERSSRALARIERSITRCTTIIDELLEFVRAPEFDLDDEQLDDCVRQIVEDFALPGGVRLALVTGAGITVRVDAHRFEQCLCNVLQNACQCMLDESGGGQLVVETLVSGARAEVRVSDTGPGVGVELREKIFEPLFSTRAFGVGLGLPLVRQVMEQHGGDVEVGESEGGGARFVLWLPLAGDGDGEPAAL